MAAPPTATPADVTCEVALRYTTPAKSTDRLTDIYLVITGEKDVTRKILLNTFQLRSTKSSEGAYREQLFEFHCRDIGKILQVNVSIESDDNPKNCLYIDFLEVTLKDKSEAYKFPVERWLGSFRDDGRCQLDLEVWKHPERVVNTDYKVVVDSTASGEFLKGTNLVYLVIHGERGKTGKLVLADAKPEKSSSDLVFHLTAPEVGKICRMELFYTAMGSSWWQLESIELKIEAKNEAYMFPVHRTLDKSLNYLELKPWTKPSLVTNL